MVPMVNNMKALRVIHRIGGEMSGVTESSHFWCYFCSNTCNLPLTEVVVCLLFRFVVCIRNTLASIENP